MCVGYLNSRFYICFSDGLLVVVIEMKTNVGFE
jgi:hypothetical protein